MFPEVKRVLVLAPHPDDGEFGCGGTLARLCEQGAEVFYSAFSLCEPSLPPGFSKQNIENELIAAAAKLGISDDHVHVSDYPVRRFSEFRQDVLEEIIKAKEKIQPDLVFLPCAFDTHQDHQVIRAEGLRAYKQTSVLGYELPWNTRDFQSSLICKLDEQQIRKKIDALTCYKSQQFRTYFQEDFILSLARVRGTQIAHRFGEAFEIFRLIA
ncbi:MAG: PIG-L deacetylase family protein [Anaerolineales bacterium]